MANDRFSAVGINIQEKAGMIWNVADLLRGPFKPHEYGLVILPMTVVKRFHDCLLPTSVPSLFGYILSILPPMGLQRFQKSEECSIHDPVSSVDKIHIQLEYGS